MILVTGGAGFIGSNLVRALNESGESDILIVDNLGPGPKFRNLFGLQFADYIDKRDFRRRLVSGAFDQQPFKVIYHQGACTSTTETNAAYVMDNNYEYSKELLHFALHRGIPFIYASSAATYGGSGVFREEPEYERPLHVYGFSKLALDNYARTLFSSVQSTVVGLRYFNVYGPNEAHKGRMSSVIHQFSRQARETGVIQLFKGSGGYKDGEQRRDFVYVGDIVRINLFLAEGPVRKGIYNAGTGRSASFNDVARAVIAMAGPGRIEYVDFPEDLNGKYQHLTQADLTRLRATGYRRPFMNVEQGVALTFQAAQAASCNA
jgi:ADP-L-glycero-D-manno-heptose 6-epimerase